MLPCSTMGDEAGADSLGMERGDLVGAEMILQRLQAARRDRFADMRMVEDDEIVARAQVGDRMRLEPFERLLVPAEFAIGPGRRRRGTGVLTARTIPGPATGAH